MPWSPDDAPQHTAKAATPKLRELWAKVANERLEAGDSDAAAIRQANAVIEEHASAASDVRRGRHRWI